MAQKMQGGTGNRSKRTLVMLSGGIDSTAALWHVLNRPNDYGQVHVHHINIQNIEARWRAEAVAVKSVLQYMRDNAPASFTHSESTINTPRFGTNFLYDTETLNFMTGYMTSRDPLINKVIIGGTATDFAMGASQSVERGRAIHNSFHPNIKDHSTKVKEYPHFRLTKKQVYETLPPELAVLTWSCRTPHYADGKPIECGRCKTCLLELRGIDRPTTAGRKVYK
jgi:7-cyano-7-deazaguanine synthase in queuosine biosynthesis